MEYAANKLNENQGESGMKKIKLYFTYSLKMLIYKTLKLLLLSELLF